MLKVSTSGGALLKADPLAGVSLGGTLAVTNIAVDLTTKRIYASITGNFTGVANNTYAAYDNTEITTKDNFYLWDYASLTGPTVVNAAGTYTNAITGLTITTDGYKHFVSALRLYELGASTLQGVTNFGSINSTINVSAVPEPSTYAMALAGLALVGVAARRARKA
ncbi:MAG TPA: PEP-CTERM sorting domain-containing protein [Candidatus Aquabacterium excrementipullorum]|nr:PEP-CTERM sorting domain-containing protein [Candidatus Aquabacterium excrementipullorum]